MCQTQEGHIKALPNGAVRDREPIGASPLPQLSGTPPTRSHPLPLRDSPRGSPRLLADRRAVHQSQHQSNLLLAAPPGDCLRLWCLLFQCFSGAFIFWIALTFAHTCTALHLTVPCTECSVLYTAPHCTLALPPLYCTLPCTAPHLALHLNAPLSRRIDHRLAHPPITGSALLGFCGLRSAYQIHLWVCRGS